MQSASRIGQRVFTTVEQVGSFALHKIKRRRYRSRRPTVPALGQRIISDLQVDGVATTSLDELGFESNASFREAATAAVTELRALAACPQHGSEYGAGSRHAVRLPSERIAKSYPAIYMWGLDEELLDIVERYIGLPVAYHGPILRQELVDGKEIFTRAWHLDAEDRDITRLTIYLTDVLHPDDGAFEYIPRNISPSYKDFVATCIRNEDMECVVPAVYWKSVCGPAGTVLLKSVSKIFHHGRVPRTPRIAVSYYYTSRTPTWPGLCRHNSFQAGMASLDVDFTPRQLACLWEYRELLRGN